MGFSRGAHSLGHLSAIPDRVQGVGVARQQVAGGVAVRELHQPAGRVVAIGGLDAVRQCEARQAPGCRVGVDRHAAVPIGDRVQAARRVVRVGEHFAARVDQVRALPSGVVGVVRVPARRFNAQGTVEGVVVVDGGARGVGDHHTVPHGVVGGGEGEADSPHRTRIT